MQTQPPAATQDKSAAADSAAAVAAKPVESLSVLVTVTPATLARLGVDPMKASKDEIATALSAALENSGAEEGGENADVAALQAQLAAANATIAALQAAALADDLAEQLDGCGLDDAAIQVIASLPADQRDTMIALFKKQAAKPAAEATPAAPAAEAATGTQAAGAQGASGTPSAPPPPIHSKAAAAAPSAEDKAKEAEALITKIKNAQGSKFRDYTTAREEARRQRADLFA